MTTKNSIISKEKQNSRRSKRNSKKLIKNHKLNVQNKVNEFAEQIQANLPHSDKWFQELWKKFKVTSDEYNSPFGGIYIPNCINHEFKYIIDLGPEFVTEKQIVKDNRKDAFFMEKGYVCFRVKVNNLDSFDKMCHKVINLRNNSKGLK